MVAIGTDFLRCGAAKSDTHAVIADMPPARRGLKSGAYDPRAAIKVEESGHPC